MKLISFEGIDGVGKTTIVSEVFNKLSIKGYNVCLLNDPGVTKMGLEIRKLIKSDLERNTLTELFLFASARSELVAEIEKIKDNFDFIILDRYIDSTVAYQGYGNKTSLDWINSINDILLNDNKYLPNKTYYIYIDEHERLKRIKERKGELDKFDTNSEFLNKVKVGYEKIITEDKRFKRIYNKSVDTAVDEIVNDIINNV